MSDLAAIAFPRSEGEVRKNLAMQKEYSIELAMRRGRGEGQTETSTKSAINTTTAGYYWRLLRRQPLIF